MRMTALAVLLLLAGVTACDAATAGGEANPGDANGKKADAAIPSRPAVEAIVRDMAKVAAHWDTSIYGQLWNDPILAGVRKKAEDPKGDAMGFSLVAMLKNLRSFDGRWLGLRLDSFGNQVSTTSFCGDFGAYAEEVERKVHATMYLDLIEKRAVPGADSAFGSRDDVLARFGSTVLAMPTRSAAPIAPWKIAPHDGDLFVRIDPRALCDSIRAILKDEQARQFEAAASAIAPLLGTIEQRYEIVPEGILQRWKTDIVVPGLAPLDREVPARLPATALTVLAIGFDGKSFWSKGRQPLLEFIAARNGGAAKPSAQEAEQGIDRLFTQLKFDFTLAELVNNLHGTIVVAITPGAPLPAATIAIPRSRQCDVVVEWFMKSLKQPVPAEGAQSFLTLGGLPAAIMALRDRGHWVLTTDPALATAWLGGKPGGWAQSPAGTLALSKSTAATTILGSSDSTAALRTSSGYLQPVINSLRGCDDADKRGLMQALAKLAEKAAPGYLVAAFEQGRLAGECRGVVGNWFLPACWAGLVMPKPVGDTTDGGLGDGLGAPDPR